MTRVGLFGAFEDQKKYIHVSRKLWERTNNVMLASCNIDRKLFFRYVFHNMLEAASMCLLKLFYKNFWSSLQLHLQFFLFLLIYAYQMFLAKKVSPGRHSVCSSIMTCWNINISLTYFSLSFVLVFEMVLNMNFFLTRIYQMFLLLLF